MQIVIALVLMIAAAAITAMTSQGPPKPQAAKIGDFSVPQSAEGTAQTVIFGDVWIDDWSVLWFGNLSSQPIYANSKK